MKIGIKEICRYLWSQKCSVLRFNLGPPGSGVFLILLLVLLDPLNDIFPQLLVMFLDCLLKALWNIQRESVAPRERDRSSGRLALFLLWCKEPFDL